MRCNVREDEVRLFDAIYEGRIGSICERCAIIENIPLIKKPQTSQLRESEKGVNVYDRMKRLSGIRDEKGEEIYFREDKLNELDKNPELEIPEKEKLNLINHFHWEIMKNRRRKGLSQQQLAEILGESEIAIQMIEKEKLPENVEVLIKKLEQFFQIRLRKVSEINRILEQKKKEDRPVLLDIAGRELDIIPEEEIFEIESKDFEVEGGDINELKNLEKSREKKGIKLWEEPEDSFEIPEGDFEVKKVNLSQVKIADLKEIHRRKIEATRQEQKEEQERIEERQRMIEAEREKKQRLIEQKKEELRLRREKESGELDKVLGGRELLEKKEQEDERKRLGKKSIINDFKVIEEFEEELI